MTDVWGVRWHVATLPDNSDVPDIPVPPARPDIPPVTYDPATGNPIDPVLDPSQQELQDQYVAALQVYAGLVAEREDAIDVVLADPSNWGEAVTVLPDESAARDALATLVAVNAGNKYAKEFTLVTSPPYMWTPVE